MRWRSKCKRELRLVQFGDNITLQASGVHAHAHETQHCLSVATLTSIHEAVQHNVTQSSTEIRRTVSREERHLTVLHQRKVQRVVVKERSKVMEAMAPPEVGFSMRSHIGSIKQYAHENDMRRLVARHSDEADSFHLDLHHFCVLATTFSDESQEFSMFYATPYMLLTTLRVVISEWPLNVFVDLTHGFCANKVKMIGYGVNTIGWKFMPIMMGTIPDNPGEPSEMYTSAWEIY
jgi:hypothetical protein